MALVCLAYLAVMLVGYWGYGNFVQDNVVQSMMFPPTGPEDAFASGPRPPRLGQEPSSVGTVMALLVTTYLLLGFGLFFTCIMSTVQQLGTDEASWTRPGTW